MISHNIQDLLKDTGLAHHGIESNWQAFEACLKK